MSKTDTKTRRYEKTYLVVHLDETDGDIQIRRMTRCDIEALAKTRHFGDFAVIDGEVLKPFCKKLDIGRLR